MVNKLKYSILSGILLCALPAHAQKEISMNTAQMQALDKITGRVSIIDVPVGGEAKFGSFSVVVRTCKTRPEGEIPENFAFVDVTDKSFNEAEYNIFKGWMFSSKPAVNAVEHPIYDVWLLKCYEGDVNPNTLLTAEALAQRDQLPRLQEVRQQQEEMKENHFVAAERQTIQFKDSMYREEKQKEKDVISAPEKIDGAPENLLNIKESFEDVDEQIVVIPAEDLSDAMAQEKNLLDKSFNPAPIDDDLSSAIDQELAKQK